MITDTQLNQLRQAMVAMTWRTKTGITSRANNWQRFPNFLASLPRLEAARLRFAEHEARVAAALATAPFVGERKAA